MLGKILIFFKTWALNNGYKDNLSIDRIDVNGNYEPNNCRWVDGITQCNNQRSNIVLTKDNKSQSIAKWARELNIPVSTLYKRHSKGWDNEKVLTFNK